MEDLEEIQNTLLPSYSARSNWKCVQGYQHDLLRTGELRGDLFFFKSTATGFHPRELDAYVALLSTTAKYVYFAEAWEQPVDSLNLLKIVKPEDVDPDKPVLSGDGYFFNNFFALFDRHGFEVLQSDLYPSGKYTLHIVARNKNF